MISSLVMLATLAAGVPEVKEMTATNTRFSVLRSRFESSQDPSTTFVELQQKLRGWNSGRCFLASNPNQASGNLLIFETREDVDNFGNVVKKEKLTVIGVGNDGSGGAPNYFDNLSPRQRSAIQDYVDSVYSVLPEVYTVDRSMAGHSAQVPEVRYDVRANADDQYFYVRVGRIDGDAPFAYCLFFKKVK